MTTAAPPARTCSNCNAGGLSSPHCPTCGGPTFTPSVSPPAGSHAAQPVGNPQASYGPPGQGVPPPKKTATWVKVLVIVGGLFLTMIVGCVALLGTAANEIDKELKEESSGDVSDASEIKTRAGVNQPLSLEGTTYQVLSAQTAQSVGDQFSRETANGTFVIVKIALTNQKNEPATILASEGLRLVGGNGSAYSTSDELLMAVEDELVLEEIQPGLREQGTLVYDVPPAAVAGAELQVEDLFSDDKGRIKLGL